MIGEVCADIDSPRPTPSCSAATVSGRPLTALCSVIFNRPRPTRDSLLVRHRTRSIPVSLLKDSVDALPLPDDVATVFHTTTSGLAGGGEAASAQLEAITAASDDVSRGQAREVPLHGAGRRTSM